MEKTALKIARWSIYLVLFAPLLVSSKFFFPFITPKILFFRTLIEIGLFFYLILAFKNPNYRPRFSKIGWALLIFILIITLAGLLGINSYRSFWSTAERGEGLLTIFHLFTLFVMAISIFKTRKDWLKLFDLSVIATLLVGLYAFGQKLDLSSFILHGPGRLSATIGNPSFLAAYLLFGIFLTLFLFFQKKDVRWRIFYTAVFIFQLFILFDTRTRGAILALLAGFFLLAVLNIFLSNKKIKLASLIFILLLISAVAFVWASRDQTWVTNSPVLNRLANISPESSTVQSRLLVWQTSWQGWKEKFWLGYGYENYNVAFDKYYNSELYSTDSSFFDRAHNIVFDQALTSGLIGLLSYLTILSLAIFTLFKKSFQNKKNFQSYSVLAVGLLVYFGQNLFVFDTINSYLMFFLILSFIARNQLENKEQEKKLKFSPIIQLAGVSILVLAFLSAFYLFNLNPALASYQTSKALSLSSIGQDQLALKSFKKALSYQTYQNEEISQKLAEFVAASSKRGVFNQEQIADNFNLAISHIKESIEKFPRNVKNHIYLMSLYNKSGQPDKALKEEEKALKLSPQRLEIYYQIGEAKILQEKYQEAIEYFKKAIELNEKVFDSHWNLVATYILANQEEKASQQLEKMANLGFNYKTPTGLSRLAKVYIKKEDFEKAISLYQEIIELEPDKAEHYAKLAALYAETGQREKAIETAQKAVQLDPQFREQAEIFIKSLEEE